MLKQILAFILYFSIFMSFQINGIRAESSINDLLKNPRIINGSDASLNAAGHQASIRRREDDSTIFGNGHQCGGSLISDNVVLSAAHCFIDESGSNHNGSFLPEKDFIVVMGTLDRLEYTNNTLVFDIVKIVKHDESFNLTTNGDDIVLLLLNGTVPAKHPTVRQIILNEGPIKNNTICQATGWGINENYVRPEKLKVVDQPYIDFHDCQNKTAYGSLLGKGMLCAGFLEGGRGPCSADSGGPLVCRGIQAGIVSWGVGCANPLSPTVYADVAYYKDWILKEVAHYNGTLPKFASIPDVVTSVVF